MIGAAAHLLAQSFNGLFDLLGLTLEVFDLLLLRLDSRPKTLQ